MFRSMSNKMVSVFACLCFSLFERICPGPGRSERLSGRPEAPRPQRRLQGGSSEGQCSPQRSQDDDSRRVHAHTVWLRRLALHDQNVRQQ